MKKNKVISSKKLIKLKNLQAGTPFIFSGGETCFKNMYLVYPSDARCVVEGFKISDKRRDSDNGTNCTENWEHFKDNCSPGAEVFIDDSRDMATVKQDKTGTFLKIAQTSLSEENNCAVVEEKKEKKEKKERKSNKVKEVSEDIKAKGKRGRKPGLPKIAFPADREFTAPELVRELGLKPYIVSNELNKALKEGRIESNERRTSGKGRGRHCKVFKMIKA